MTSASPPPPANAWLPGQQVAQYTLVRPIGLGGMAEVWLAYVQGSFGFRKPIALKRMNAELAKDREFVAMFLDEARLVSRLTHPGIAQVLELGQSGGGVYVAMEYLAGETVSSVMRAAMARGVPIPFGVAVKLVIDAADALHSAHERTDDTGAPLMVVHRDVSPQNLMVTYDGHVKLLDFGIAKAAQRSVMTQSGQLKGKLSYMAPEQARGDAIDARADQFALGVVLFELVTGTRLYPTGGNEWDLLRHVAGGTEPLPTALERSANAPPALSAIIARAMERDAGRRYPTMAAFRAELERWLVAAAGAVPTREQLAALMTQLFPEHVSAQSTLMTQISQVEAKTEPMAHTARRSRRWPAVVLLALGAAVVGAAAVELTRQAPPSTPPLVVEPTPLVTGVAAVTPLEPPPSVPEDVEVDAGAPRREPLDAPSAPEPPPPQRVDAHDRREAEKEKAERLARVRRAQPKKPPGRLSIKTTPWTQVYLGSKTIGETPLVDVALPPGTHRLRLVNVEKGIDTTIEVVIVSGKVTLKTLRL